MQILVYLFIAIASGAIGAATYFGLAFTPIEAGLSAAVALSLALVVLERRVHIRSEKRMEKAIDDLSRLLSTDAQAGQVLSQRINTLADLEPGQRLDTLEADISVLGTVVSQVAEAVAELENAMPEPVAETAADALDGPDEMPRPVVETAPEPAIPLAALREALSNDRLVFHMQPVMTLPQRRPYGYDLVPRLMLDNEELADPPDFMPLSGGEDLVRRINRMSIDEGVDVIRRARAAGQPATLYVPMSRLTLSDPDAAEYLTAQFEANRALARNLTLCMSHRDWREMGATAKRFANEIAGLGLSFCLTAMRSLRLDFGELADAGIRSIRVGAAQFTGEPQGLTDFHSSDVTAYLARFGIDLVIEEVDNEQQILTALEDGVRLAVGPHLAPPAPVRPDLLVRRSSPAVTGQQASGA